MKGNTKGITLVALVVTIVVLLILAGITINTLFSDNGIIKKAQDAVNATNKSGQDEQQSLQNLANQLEEYTNGINDGNNSPNPSDLPTIAELIASGDMQVGDYIEYDQGTGTFNVDTSQTGYDKTQTFDKTAYNGVWRVLYADSSKIEIISQGKVIENLYLKGKAGYNNILKTLNNISNQYTNNKYAIRGRTFGSNPENPSLDTTKKAYEECYNSVDTNLIETYFPDALGTSTYLTDDWVYHNEDRNALIYFEDEILPSLANTWVPIRRFDSWCCCLRFEISHLTYICSSINPERSNFLYEIKDEEGIKIEDEPDTNGVCPVISLKLNCHVESGDGTEYDPWILEQIP